MSAGCGSAPETFAEVDPSITEFNASGPNLNFTSQIGLLDTGKTGMVQVAQVVEKITKGVQAQLPGLSKDTRYVQLQMHFDSTDRLGNKGFIDFGSIRFPVDDLMKAKLDNMFALQLLNLADEISPGPAIDMAVEYCGDPENSRVNGEFCRKLQSSMDN